MKRNKIIIGSANFNKNYKTASQKNSLYKIEINKILKCAEKNNITEIDTAVEYKNSEKLIGEFIKNNKNSNKWKIITKIKYKKNDNFLSIISKSIKKLNKSPHAILAHDLKTYQNKKFHKALDKFPNIKRGISVYEKQEVLSAIKFKKPEIVQFPINILDKRFEKNGFLQFLKKKKIETHARSIFLNGILHSLDNHQVFQNSVWYEKINKSLFKSKDKKFRLSAKSLIDLNYNKSIDKIVLGVDNIIHLKKNLNLMKKNYKNRKIFKIKFKHNLKSNMLDPRRWN